MNIGSVTTEPTVLAAAYSTDFVSSIVVQYKQKCIMFELLKCIQKINK